MGIREEAQRVMARIAQMTLDEKVELHNRFCAVCNFDDYFIEDMGTWLDDDLQYYKPQEAFRLGIMAARFSYSDKWVTFDGNGNILSTDDPEADHCLSVYDIAHEVAARGEADKDPAQWFGDLRLNED